MNVKSSFRRSLSLCLFLFLLACRKAEPWPVEEMNEWYSGGKQTIWDNGAGAFSHLFPEISSRNEFIHEVGDLAFESTFVSAGNLNPGLGPVYNSVSCTSCHISDGRGTPIGPGSEMISLLIRMSLDGYNAHGGPNPVPGFGGQLQQNAIFGAMPEADVQIIYSELSGLYDDGSTYSLRKPTYEITNSYIPLPVGTMFSPRIAPPVFGLGLLEALSEDEILEYADEYDMNGDGISGKPNYVWNIRRQTMSLGMFGWKAGQPDILQQTAGAYHEDMGITSFLFPVESVGYSSPDIVADPEISDSILHAAAFYVKTLAVPGRRGADNERVIEGKNIFNAIGCADCHRPMMVTKDDMAFTEVSHQYIFPYTDMLLHDMGEDLADFRPEFAANGYEWRTPPLWGIGLTNVVNGHQNFLHDGRARSLEEAILWHGGEAENSNQNFKQLSASQRETLILFLESL